MGKTDQVMHQLNLGTGVMLGEITVTLECKFCAIWNLGEILGKSESQ